MHRVVWKSQAWRTLRRHFESAGRREDGAFLLLRVGRSATGCRLLVEKVLLPPKGALETQGPDALRPSGQWLSAVIGAAIESRTGLGFIHSHPDPAHPPNLSPLDWQTSVEWSKSITPNLKAPFSSLVWSPRGVAGIVFSAESPQVPIAVDRAESLGDGSIEILDSRQNEDPNLDDRQIRALSKLGNAHLRALNVGVVGVGGTGSPLAEQLVRLGVSSVLLVDPDVLDDVSNLRRVVGSSAADMGKPKAQVVGNHLHSLGLNTQVTPLTSDIRHESVFRRLLDCDLLFGTTDTHSSRAFINQVAYQYSIPTIDVGMRVGITTTGAVSGMPVEVRVLLPDNGCLWCRSGVLSSQNIYEENLPLSERQRLASEGYVQALGEHQPSLTALNYFAAALAALTMLRLYSGRAVSSASAIFDPWEQYIQNLSATINPKCICSSFRGMADDLPISFLTESKSHSGL